MKYPAFFLLGLLLFFGAFLWLDGSRSAIIGVAAEVSSNDEGPVSSDSPPNSANRIRVKILWLPQAQFAGFYVASADGLYREAGLEITFAYPETADDVFDALESGEADFVVAWPLPAIDPELNYGEGKIHLDPGDTLILYTDGVTEAMDKNGELFGENRLKTCVETAPLALSPEEFLHRIKEALAVYTARAEQSDDITLFILTYIGSPSDDSSGLVSSDR